jgi:hypothetical protein
MRGSFVACASVFVALGCGAVVRPSDSGVETSSSPDTTVDIDASVRDVSSDLLVLDRPDTGTVANDTGIPSDVVRDVIDAGVADARECVEGDAILSCRRFYRLAQGDLGARFACCNGRCESGNCMPRSPEGTAICGRTPCDIRAGQICCPGVVMAGCFPRDRNLCP